MRLALAERAAGLDAHLPRARVCALGRERCSAARIVPIRKMERGEAMGPRQEHEPRRGTCTCTCACAHHVADATERVLVVRPQLRIASDVKIQFRVSVPPRYPHDGLWKEAATVVSRCVKRFSERMTQKRLVRAFFVRSSAPSSSDTPTSRGPPTPPICSAFSAASVRRASPPQSTSSSRRRRARDFVRLELKKTVPYIVSAITGLSPSHPDTQVPGHHRPRTDSI